MNFPKTFNETYLFTIYLFIILIYYTYLFILRERERREREVLKKSSQKKYKKWTL